MFNFFMKSVMNFSTSIIYYFKGLSTLVRYVFTYLLNPLVLTNKMLTINIVTNTSLNSLISYFILKKKWNFLVNSFAFFIIDYIYIYFISKAYNINEIQNFNLRIKTRFKQVNWSFYNDLYKNNNSKLFFSYYLLHYYSGLKFIWNGLRYWFLGLILGFSAFYYLMYIRLLPFNKIIFEWILIIMFLYWLLSGFVFFIKKYQYSKFTTVIQRFWKRSYILFWLIESVVFLIFFFLTLNASEEPTYMYDQIKLFKTHLFSWRWFLIKLIPVITLIVIGYFLLLSLKWNIFSKQSLILVFLTLVLIYIFWLEFYQFFHIINFYGNLVWVYDYDEFLWNLELEFRRTRLSNNYVAVCLLAKFWHLVFIFVFWIFFMLRVNEIGRVRYPLLAANLQNFIILYIMSWLYMYPWLKFLFKRHLETPYYWFFFNARRLGLRVFFTDIKLYFYSIISYFNYNPTCNFSFKNGLFFYWFESSSEVGFNQYKKFLIRDLIIETLQSNNIISANTINLSI